MVGDAGGVGNMLWLKRIGGIVLAGPVKASRTDIKYSWG
jgi:hypothetical protein